jgi:very-long-chain (3R)-3-hydroxyacyl-CoA dehydratase
VKDSRVAGLLLLTWTVGDTIRYPFYIQTVLGRNVKIITWLRYSAWIVLYPIGILAEAVVIYSNLEDIKRTGRYSFPLPNMLNVSFDPIIAIYSYLFGFLFIASYFMLGYMWRQRKRVLGQVDRKEK